MLRRFCRGDAVAMHAVLSDPQVMRFWSTPPHETFTQTQEWVDSTIAAVAAGQADEFAVVHDAHLIGKAGFWKGPEIGFILARAAWGQGFATEAVAAVCDHAFATGRDIITADVDPVNERSLRLLLGLGFHETGRAERTVCVDGIWADSVYLERRAPTTALR
jgi:RimJ/RimL family protein N-acetyltransferase